MGGEPTPVEQDSRGVLNPWLLRQRLTLTRYPPISALSGLVDRFWAVRWDLPPGLVHRQQVLTHPGVNIFISHPDGATPSTHTTATGLEAQVSGVSTAVTERHLAGQGWAVDAMTTPGGFGAFLTGPVADLTDQAHLIRGFRAATGRTPAAYAAALRSGPGG